MAGFYLTKKAQEDLKAIGQYTQQTWGREQRNRYLTILDNAFSDLVTHPLLGQDCHKIRQAYRQYPIGKHLIFYRQTENAEIEIVRILHKRMAVEQHLLYP